MTRKFKRLREACPVVLGLKLKLRVTQVKKMGLNLVNMQRKIRELEELAQMTSGVYLFRVVSQETWEETEH